MGAYEDLAGWGVQIETAKSMWEDRWRCERVLEGYIYGAVMHTRPKAD